MEKKNRKQSSTADFKQYYQFKNDPKGAIKFLRRVRNGACIKVLKRDDIGYISIVWGENDPKTNLGYGLKHIIEKHGKSIERMGYKVEEFIPIVLQECTEINHSVPGKIILESEHARMVLSKNFKGRNMIWLLTAFDIKKKGKSH